MADTRIFTNLNKATFKKGEPSFLMRAKRNLADNYIKFNYKLYEEGSDTPLEQLNISKTNNEKYKIDLFVQGLNSEYFLETLDISVSFNADIFLDIQPSDIKIANILPVANSIRIDNEAGLIRFTAANLSELGLGNSISNDEMLIATIDVIFDKDTLEQKEVDSLGMIIDLPLKFTISVNKYETILSKDFFKANSNKDIEVKSLYELGGEIVVIDDIVILYHEYKEQDEDCNVKFRNRTPIWGIWFSR